MVENDVRALPVHLANDAQPFTRPAPCESPRRGALCPLVRVARVGYAVLQLDLPSPAREPPNMAEWYYARNNQRLGPVSMEQLKQLSSRGELSPTDLVWKDGMANWAAANTVTGLFTAAAPAPMAPRQAAVVAPAPGVTDDDVVQLMPGSGSTGGTEMEQAPTVDAPRHARATGVLRLANPDPNLAAWVVASRRRRPVRGDTGTLREARHWRPLAHATWNGGKPDERSSRSAAGIRARADTSARSGSHGVAGGWVGRDVCSFLFRNVGWRSSLHHAGSRFVLHVVYDPGARLLCSRSQDASTAELQRARPT